MKVYSTDICVPISKLVNAFLGLRNMLRIMVLAPMVGHVGDGDFHSIILYDPQDKQKQKLIN